MNQKWEGQSKPERRINWKKKKRKNELEAIKEIRKLKKNFKDELSAEGGGQLNYSCSWSADSIP